MAVYTETIKLEDQVSPAAKAAAAESKILSSALDSVNQSLVKASALGDIDGFRKLTKDSGALKAALGQVDQGLLSEVAAAKTADAAASALAKSTADAEKKKTDAVKTATQKQIADQTKMANTLSVVKDAVGNAAQSMKGALVSLASGDVKGAISGVTDTVAGLAKLLDLVVPGLGQAVAAVVQIAGGLVGLSVGLIKSGVEFAIASSEAKQEMLGLFDAMGGGLVTGAQTEEMIDGIKEKFGVAKDSLIGYTKALMAMGRNDLGQMENDLVAVASAAALVKGGDQALLGFIKKIDLATEAGIGLKIPTKQLAALGETGANVGDVAAVMGVSVAKLTKDLAAGTVDAAKFGDALQTAIIKKGEGPLARMANSSANLKKIFSESMGDLFEDIDVGPFMEQVKQLLGIFSQSTDSGKTMKAAIGGYFKEVLSLLTQVVPMAKHFLLDMIIYGLRAYLAIKPIVKAIKDFATSAAGVEIITTVLSALWTILKVIGVAILIVVAVLFAFWAISMLIAVAVWVVIGALIGLAVDAVGLLAEGFTYIGGVIGDFVGEALASLIDFASSAGTAAADFVQGLVDGIAAGASAVVGAVKGLADAATGAFKGALGIKSPSRVMMGLGAHTGGGVVEGIQSTEGDVHGAASSLAGAAVKGASSDVGGVSGGGGSKAGAQINVTVLIDGAGKDALAITQEMVSSVFQQMALQAGV